MQPHRVQYIQIRAPCRTNSPEMPPLLTVAGCTFSSNAKVTGGHGIRRQLRRPQLPVHDTMSVLAIFVVALTNDRKRHDIVESPANTTSGRRLPNLCKPSMRPLQHHCSLKPMCLFEDASGIAPSRQTPEMLQPGNLRFRGSRAIARQSFVVFAPRDPRGPQLCVQSFVSDLTALCQSTSLRDGEFRHSFRAHRG